MDQSQMIEVHMFDEVVARAEAAREAVDEDGAVLVELVEHSALARALKVAHDELSRGKNNIFVMRVAEDTVAVLVFLEHLGGVAEPHHEAVRGVALAHAVLDHLEDEGHHCAVNLDAHRRDQQLRLDGATRLQTKKNGLAFHV